MLEYGYDNYTMFVGERLGNTERQSIRQFSIQAAAMNNFVHPNCLILRKERDGHSRKFGLPDSAFEHLNGREKMITKMPIRLLSLSMLDLINRERFWDIGFCTGSVSIEAKLLFPHLHITSFEIREEGRKLMTENCHRFGTPGIEAIIGDFLSVDLSALEAPDAIFIGGHGGKLVEIRYGSFQKDRKRSGSHRLQLRYPNESKALLEEAGPPNRSSDIRPTYTIDDFNTITVNVIYKL